MAAGASSEASTEPVHLNKVGGPRHVPTVAYPGDFWHCKRQNTAYLAAPVVVVAEVLNFRHAAKKQDSVFSFNLQAFPMS